ncbi:MASE1 domain-containing protein [Patescibacteria group bacterium]|nr:MASE1 domain-containing protein [Patescibacteria group bacterium]MBU1501012.1 MASE1 domain-containing protein [Patescibacteria group bacterium]MBU2080642.1 MASE1 domain-containing protein [Patescibacteria group bacterium]MBU2124283.1 MASE1 domain-containing protein [Patescibacteria group bacterium]MBU2194409.1 MASE1 domain-containing protein [Patescibacteria group bacterium]
MRFLVNHLSTYLYTPRTSIQGIFLFLTYTAVAVTAFAFLPASAFLFPAAGIALGGLFISGIRLWPFIFIGTLLACLYADLSLLMATSIAVIQTFQAIAGAFLLRKMHIDPLFRRYRDTFGTITTLALVSFIAPTALLAWYVLNGVPVSAAEWGRGYVALLFVLLATTPFVLRWCAKPAFGRHLIELIETLAVFAILIVINYFLFIGGTETILGIPLLYFIFIPFFWIALRLRPRFVTLAVLITSAFAILSTLLYTADTELPQVLFETETFLITISIIFYVIVSLEEDRRLNTNLMRSQLATLENAIARISTESKAKNDFIAILAHELRNPLAPIMSGIDLLKLKGTADKEDEELLEVMHSRMGTVRRLLDDLLDVSRISEGKISIAKERVSLTDTLKRAMEATDHYIKERHQTLVLKGFSQSLFVNGDAVRLEQIFSNLITNASKYSDSGDAITITLLKKKGTARITIKDNGIGISPEGLENIFTPFHQIGDTERTKKGLGIGLALVKSFTEVHEGTIQAESKGLGKGSEFIVELPLAENT